ncbi:hypothetical protein [Marinobacter sp.]|uniref:hypothetical protein n=1 Tax=Marinobacter sp. TaxID=50741 RepID=UPI003A910BE8
MASRDMVMNLRGGMRLCVAVGVLFLGACSDGRGSGSGVIVDDSIETDSDDTIDDGDDEIVLPALSTQLEHWSKTGVFLAAADCAQCHTASVPGDSPAVMREPDPQVSANQPSPDGEDISPFFDWKSSVMANAFTDPYFRAAMMHEAETFPHLAGLIEDTCLTCHSPMARIHAHQTGVGLEQDDTCTLADGCYRAEQALEDPHAREGISCTVCHQITDSVLSGDVNSGNFEIADVEHPDAFTIFGPYQNPVGQAMQNRVGYTPQYSSHMSDSRHCASCHELFTPTIDMETDLPNGEGFPEQVPYTEWVNSDFGPGGTSTTSCQQCHMARTEISDNFMTRVAVTPNGTVNQSWPERQPYSPHVMVGGNTWLLETLEMFREELGRAGINQEGEFSDTAELTREFLKTAADLVPSGQNLSGNELAFDLSIQNNTGHKLPTSYPSRRIWVATQVTDSKGAVLFSSGFPDENYHLVSDARYTSQECLAAKKPEGFDSAGCYQSHVMQVSSPDDIPVYELVLGSTTDAITHILLYASGSLKDNRIPPRGFDSSAVPEWARPEGVEGDMDFNLNNLGQDTIAYRLTLPVSAVPPLTVETTLYYQNIRPTFVEGLHGEHSWIDEFHGIVALNPPRAEVLATATFQVQ